MNNIPSSDPEPSASLIDDSAAGTLSPDSSTAENSEPQIQDSLRPPRSRRGSVARLPKELRDQINQKLDDGFSYSVICDHLRAEGIELSQHAIGRWKRGGYQDYLRERQLLEQSRLRYELTLDLARQEKGIDAFQAAHKIAAALICETVAQIGADSLRQAIKLNPLNFLRLLNCLSRLTTGGLKCERHLLDEAELQARLNPPPPPQKGISPETLKQFEHLLGMR